VYKGEESIFECNKIYLISKADNTSSTKKVSGEWYRIYSIRSNKLHYQ